MTILQINVCNNVYSTGKIASHIGELAVESGWTSYIAYAKADAYAPSRNIPIPIGSKFDYYLHVLETRLFDNPGLGLTSRLATRELIKKIELIQPSVIHLHILHGYYLNVKVLFHHLSRLNIPIIWTVHSCWKFTGHCCYFDIIGCDKWKTECKHCPQTRSYPKSWFRDRSKKNYLEKKGLFCSVQNMTLVPVSNWLAGLLKDSFLGSYPIIPIYNGVDIHTFSPSANSDMIRKNYGLSSSFVAIGVASSWDTRKNLRDYLRLAQVIPGNVKILLVGLNKHIIKALPQNIIGLERTTSVQELVEIYTAADVVLNLSLEETFGLTTVEGFACGTPSIVYNCTASPELITEETGFIVEPGDIEGVLECINIIVRKGKASYSHFCRQRALDHFDNKKNYKQYIELYNKLVYRTGSKELCE